VWVPETRRTAADLLLLSTAETKDDPSVALKLIYVTLSKLVSWMVLRTRSDACGCRELCHRL
jgi:hypothetical protein